MENLNAISNAMEVYAKDYADQQTKELREEIEMKTKYYEDKLEHQHITLSEHYKENEGLKEVLEDKRKLTLDIEKILFGDNGAKNPSMGDVLKSIIQLKEEIDRLKDELKIQTECPKEFVEKICDNCPYNDYEMVGHPGGSSVHSVKKHFCKLGNWTEDF